MKSVYPGDPCVISGVYEASIILKEDIRPERYNSGSFTVGAPLFGVDVCRFALISGFVSKSLHKFLKDVPIIQAGDEYEIRPGVTVKVHESFVDPRVVDTGQEEESKWITIHRQFTKSFPESVEEFERIMKRHFTIDED
jgi:hypothetical protein